MSAASRVTRPAPGRMSAALALSLLAHILLLSMTLGGNGAGLPGLQFPWKERRLAANDLQVLLAPARPTDPAPAAVPRAAVAIPSSIRQAAVVRAPLPRDLIPPVVQPSEVPGVSFSPPPLALEPPPAPTPAPSSTPAPSHAAVVAIPPPAVKLPIAPDAPPTRPSADKVARAAPAPGSDAPSPGNTDNAAQKQIDKLARDQALSQARLKQEQEQRNTELLRQAELAAAQREAARQQQQQLETARAEQAARNEAARLEAERLELARVRQEQATQEAAREALAQAEAARQERARQEQAQKARAEQESRLAQARQDASKEEAARQAQAKQEEAQRERAQQESKREERLRAIANQLKQEAAQPTTSSLRRGWLFGRADPNADLVLYAETLRRKIELNMTFGMVRDVAKQSHTQPIVTMAIRADGSVEKVTFVVSSGVPQIDEAIRKVVAIQAPYGPFPPALARQYDVIEIRRTWIFDTAIRLQ